MITKHKIYKKINKIMYIKHLIDQNNKCDYCVEIKFN